MNSSFKRYVAFLISSTLLGWSASFIDSFTVVNASPPALKVSNPDAIGQSNKKTILQRLSYFKYPIEVSFELKGQPLSLTKAVLAEPGFRTEEFEGDRDWLKDLTIKIKNTSGKTITWMLVNLLFPDITKDGAIALHQIFLGVDPDAPFARPELRLLPNQTLEIPLNGRYEDLKRLVNVIGSGTPIESVSKLEVEFHAALFDDETRFQTGEMFRRNPDPNDPQKWIRIKQE
jgi:hypothetical protein